VKSLYEAGPISIVEYAFLIDVRTLLSQPWRVFALIGACITAFLTWYGLELSVLLKMKAKRQREAKKWAAAFEVSMRVRDLCGWLFWGLLFVHAGLSLAPSTDWIVGYPRELIQLIYGVSLPPALRP